MAELQLSPRQRTDTARSSGTSDQRNISRNNLKCSISLCTHSPPLYHVAVVYNIKYDGKSHSESINILLISVIRVG